MGRTAIEAYQARAQEYADALGRVDVLPRRDRERIETWAATARGPILDVGCGPGHWTAHLAGLGHRVLGLDPAPAFVEIARREHPGIDYRVGAFADLPVPGPRVGGVLAWYSLIHLEPGAVPAALSRLAQSLEPGGTVLLGFFDGAAQEPFTHAVSTAQFWPVDRMAELVRAAGLEVTAVEQRQEVGARPHGAIEAVKPGT